MAPPIAALLLLLLISPAAGEIKTLKLSADSRPLILLQTFAFTPSGHLNLTVHSLTISGDVSDPSPDLGFILISDASLLAAAADPQNPASGCPLANPHADINIPLKNPNPSPENHAVAVPRPDEYSLLFVNCAGARVSVEVTAEMYNVLPDGSRDYLSVGQSALPGIYLIFSVIYFIFLLIWLYVILVNDRLSANRIHYVMCALLVAKALNLAFEAEDQHNIRKNGSPHGWDVPFYIFQFVRGVLLFSVIVLVGTGWSFLKPFLSDKEKKVIMVVIPLQVVANVASVVVGETGPFNRDYATWQQVFLLIDVLCCCAVLFPIIWSIRSLRETSKTDGKAARNLAKLTLFRQFYVVVIGYLYFTRIVVFALRTITSYKYRWVSVAAEELASLAFYVYMFYTFRPVERNLYFVLDEDEEEAAEMALREDEFEL